ncbi:hypothetical protein FN846DRAFT_977617 [Sphaerosporella brunnea]|uniref:Uncharacterized protein n=1 Tax=Sphaerosporella brunnea TaxID=1250544 RepID=A0A5J5EG42_9PEZI|nr:hypothetical protein FN846DRAFT_977617 [Sphaerosporella brunnea]
MNCRSGPQRLCLDLPDAQVYGRAVVISREGRDGQQSGKKRKYMCLSCISCCNTLAAQRCLRKIAASFQQGWHPFVPTNFWLAQLSFLLSISPVLGRGKPGNMSGTRRSRKLTHLVGSVKTPPEAVRNCSDGLKPSNYWLTGGGVAVWLHQPWYEAGGGGIVPSFGQMLAIPSDHRLVADRSDSESSGLKRFTDRSLLEPKKAHMHHTKTPHG